MRSHMVVGLLAVAAATLPVRAADGSTPYPPNCSFSSPLIACPAGDVITTAVIRYLDNRPVVCGVVVWFENCPSVRFPAPMGDEGYVLAPPGVVIDTDNEGQAAFGIRAGGGCGANTVIIYAAGMQITRRALASPDQDGTLGVTADDVALAESKLGSADPTADFDGNGTVSSADIQFVRAHLGHVAPGAPVPVASRSWGTLKLSYR